MKTPLFDVIISVAGTDEGSGVYSVTLVDRYHDGPEIGKVIGTSPEMPSLNAALDWARGAVTAFMEGTRA